MTRRSLFQKLGGLTIAAMLLPETLVRQPVGEVPAADPVDILDTIHLLDPKDAPLTSVVMKVRYQGDHWKIPGKVNLECPELWEETP